MRKQSHLNINEGFYSLSQLALSTSQTRLKEPQPELACNPIVNNQRHESLRKVRNKTDKQPLNEIYNRDMVLKKPGFQMQKLNETIEELAQKTRKKNKNRYKQNAFDQDLINLDQTLPSIAGNKNRKNPSKLMDQIKRVEQKIKVMKSETEQINHQKHYEYIRPFVDLHNQSVMYMQMMMAQNNKQHNCCHNCNHNNQNNQTPPPPPPQHYPYPYPYPPPHMQPYPALKQIKSIYDYSQNNYKPTSRSILQKQLKKYNLSKLRKFRGAVIAVYFQLLLPKYANRFTLRRYKAHINYLNSVNVLQLRKDIEKELREKVIKWNMIQITQKIGKARADKETNRTKQNKTAKIIITEQYNGSENYEFYLGDVELFLVQFLKTMKEAVDYDDDFENILRYAACGSMLFSFPVDHYYILDELYSLKFHPQKMYLQNNRKIAKALLLSCIFVKLITFSLFFPMKQNQDWKARMLKVNNMKKQNMIQAQMTAVQMHLSGILIHRHSMQLIEEVLQEVESNILQISPDSWPIPQAAMIFQGSGDVQSAFSAATSKKIKKRAQRLLGNKDPARMQGYKQFNLYDFTYIKNLNEFQSLLQEINKASQFKEQAKVMIVEVIDLIYQKLMGYRKEEYKRMKEDLLMEEKRLLSSKLNYSSLLGSTKRSGQQRKIIKQAIQLVQLNRQKQEGVSSQGYQQKQQNSQQKSQQSKYKKSK